MKRKSDYKKAKRSLHIPRVYLLYSVNTNNMACNHIQFYKQLMQIENKQMILMIIDDGNASKAWLHRSPRCFNQGKVRISKDF